MKSPLDTAVLSLPFGRRAFLSSALSSFLVPTLPKSPLLQQDSTVLTKGVAVGGVSRGGRRPFLEDAVQKAVVQGNWLPPSAGEDVLLPDGSARKWENIEADKDGWFQGRALAGGYLYATWDSPEERTYLLTAQGNSMVYVNGEPRAGDVYSYGTFALPVRLKQGTNSFLFVSGRGRLRAQLTPVSTAVVLRGEDNTLPDLVAGETETVWGAVHIINPQERELTGLTLRATVEGTGGEAPKTVETRLPPLPPMTVRKTGFQLAAPKNIGAGKATMRLELTGRPLSGATVTPVTLELRVRTPVETYKRTFVSEIDGTVQYYGVRPALKPSKDNAFILSLHGASVEAIGQADAYGSKDWATLVAPTNRRPYGFDWEDWGRWDALEVLEVARKKFPHDPTRVSLTGHSMGGHGTWSVGSLFPDRFAAIGPSAGWISFNTYGGRTRGEANQTPPVTALVERAANQSDTFLWASNLLSLPVYILHGDADDNVPVTQARTMKERLTALKHPALQSHEQPGAGHWWDASQDPGADCVDWKPMFELFQKSRIGPVARDGSPDTVRFITVSPAVSDRYRWARILQQAKMLLPSSLELNWEPASGTVRGTTQNIAFLALDATLLSPKGSLRQLTLDGQTLEVPEKIREGTVPLKREQGRWQIAGGLPPANAKSPERGSGFKQAFRHRFVLVYGTQGTPEENAWAYSRARYDAEAFLYRGNGSPEIVADKAFQERNFADRSLILYGNATTNSVWQRMLKDSPIVVERGKIRTGSREWTGDEVATVFQRPRPDSKVAMIAAVGAAGLTGMRLTDRLPYFVSGVAYPDWCVFDTTILEKGVEGVRAAGYFGNDWGLDSGESVYR